ncbi:hypothetical protein LOTGIDRAFT_229276 [Lottia gigantea]|uniref:DUF3719 domain-containing protein n=1 Tax=Lottia gigantea TaxID=225164 RepID=V3ZRZ1_LOTGI|nr:hypothetical protein LOTGIDRAFT_229276 [Lottia gigantea]ESO87117.1 hypothetical protein LOTGIDRAFT_229276 [Lottia gigantea]
MLMQPISWPVARYLELDSVKEPGSVTDYLNNYKDGLESVSLAHLSVPVRFTLPPIICISAQIHDRKGFQSTKSTYDDVTSCKPLLQSVGLHHSFSSSSGRSSPTSSDHTVTPGLSGLHGGWITGNSTERSSLGSSYSLDDIDQQASNTVTKHFENIKSVLFEGENSLPSSANTSQVSRSSQSSTIRECQEWRSQFHHLRSLGSSCLALSKKDEGVELIPRETSPGQHDTPDSEHVLVEGRQILPKHPPTDATAIKDFDDDTHTGFEFLREEIFAQDGVYEEILAIDDERIEDNVEPKLTVLPSRRRVGYPPITPNACITNSVMTRLFDTLWKDVLFWSWPVIQKNYPQFFDDVMQQTLDVNPSSPHQNNPSPANRQSSFTFNPRHSYLSQRANTHAGGSFDSQKSFDGILKISQIPINSREDGSGIVRPGSSIHSRQRPTTTTYRVLSKFGGKGSRLPPLNASERNKEEETPIDALHVRRLTLYTSGESISPPPTTTTYQRNGALPPLHVEKERKNYNRASSAVDNKDGRNYYNNRNYLPFDQRPSTTHAMRTDNLTLFRRSSTPQNQNQFMGGRQLNITGKNLQPSGEYPHIQPDIVEDQEGSIEDGILQTNNWPQGNSSNNNPYRRRAHRHVIQT